jgi:hypothetical protein
LRFALRIAATIPIPVSAVRRAVGQHQRFGTATRPGAVEHFEQAALIFAEGRQGPGQRL